MEQKLIRSLLNPAAYPEDTGSVELLQTHISYVFITDEYVYKMKKPVDMGFLNFTTLDRRRFYCEEEVRLNRRLCPDLYLGVVPVRQSRHGLTFSGGEMVIDYAVKMRRLPKERMLDRLLRENAVTESDIKSISRIVADFHATADTSGEIASFGRMENIARNWDENFRQVDNFVGKTIFPIELEPVRNWVLSFLEHNAHLFSQRVREGFIRDCNGDIRAEHICLADRVYIFDCIEFNERFRFTDTASDLAFILMDLDSFEKSSLAETFAAEYLTATGDSGLTRVLAFYKVYRAFVRGKVESFKFFDRNMTEEEREVAFRKARRYFRLGRGYVIRSKLPPSLLILSGLMGTGKSTVASLLSFELGVPVLRSDVVRKRLAGLDAKEPRREAFGRGIYSEHFNVMTYRSLLASAEEVLSSGGSVIVDASFQKEEDRAAFRRLAEKEGARFYILQTVCPDAVVRKRLEERESNPAEVSDGRLEIFDQHKDSFEIPRESEGVIITIDTSLSPEASIDSLLRDMKLLP